MPTVLPRGSLASTAQVLRQPLPQAVDRLTPNGSVPQGSLEDLIRQQQL
ncbi:hypothetical protein OG361_09110 [Streptomyces sp. NBC_00090]